MGNENALGEALAQCLDWKKHECMWQTGQTEGIWLGCVSVLHVQFFLYKVLKKQTKQKTPEK